MDPVSSSAGIAPFSGSCFHHVIDVKRDDRIRHDILKKLEAHFKLFRYSPGLTGLKKNYTTTVRGLAYI
jgi:hypothetical protein